MKKGATVIGLFWYEPGEYRSAGVPGGTGVITVDEIEIIRQEFFDKQKSMRSIARERGHSRKTVRKAIHEECPFKYRRKAPVEKRVSGAYEAVMREWIESDRAAPRKQRHTGRRIFQRLTEEYGYSGSERTIRREVRRLRGKVRESHVPQVYGLGDGATFDFGESTVVIGGKETKVHLGYMRLDYSSKFFVCAFPGEGLEAMMEAHERSFRNFEGTPARIRYDNLKPAVERVLRGRERKEQAKWVAFRSQYVFRAEYCAPGKGQEKGGVENLVGSFRRNHLVPLPEVRDFEELNGYLRECCEKDACGRTRQGRPVHELWLEEKGALHALPARIPAACVDVAAKVSSRQLVRFKKHSYSVPAEYVGEVVTVHGYAFKVEIAYRDKVIASHVRPYDGTTSVFDPHHYLPVLLRKPGALRRAEPIIAMKLPETYQLYHRRLQGRHEGSSEGDKEFIRILSLLKDHPREEVTAAVEKAMCCNVYSFDGVVAFLRRIHEPPPFEGRTAAYSGLVQPNRVDHFDLLTAERGTS